MFQRSAALRASACRPFARRSWGLGRHTLGSLFHYIQDPWGGWIEYSGDMDRITEDWKPNDWHCPAAVWSPEMPADFITNQEEKPA
ncbi:hypothetical protein [Streptomyces sp. AC555_RSS877]|uniref:hypothetical protein n=1 Tax=Streptomyces sp. AC555_RSS877 TaxID=2823688 RepID=UPI0020B8DD2C|nr:hypothetical protein [Streptomyces sp. AC555_RSS877]